MICIYIYIYMLSPCKITKNDIMTRGKLIFPIAQFVGGGGNSMFPDMAGLRYALHEVAYINGKDKPKEAFKVSCKAARK